MKEYDVVRVINDRARYAKAGVIKGMIGTILDPRNIDGQWLVAFADSHGFDTVMEPIKEVDLECIGNWGEGTVLEAEYDARVLSPLQIEHEEIENEGV